MSIINECGVAGEEMRRDGGGQNEEAFLSLRFEMKSEDRWLQIPFDTWLPNRQTLLWAPPPHRGIWMGRVIEPDGNRRTDG